MKTTISLAAVVFCALPIIAEEPAVSFDIDDESQSAIATLEREALRNEQTLLSIVQQGQLTMVDGNCIAELDGEHDTGGSLYAAVDDGTVKFAADIDVTLVHSTPSVTLECGPFDDCLPCPQNMDTYKNPYDQTREAGTIEFPDGVHPEGCGGGDGPGMRTPATCSITASPCIVACQTASEQ